MGRKHPKSLAWLAVFAVISTIGLWLASGARAQAVESRPVVLAEIKGAIGFITVDYLAKALEKARAENAAALVIKLDTPGGLVSSTREMIQAMLASRVPIVIYVAPSGARAASAGTYLLYASHVAAMAPGTHLGAATPISLGAPGLPGSPPPKPPKSDDKPAERDTGSAAERKSVNDAVAFIRSLAQLRNRNAEWAEKAVRDAATLTASEALEQRVIELIANDVDTLLASIDGRTVATSSGNLTLATKAHPIVEFKPDWKTEVLAIVTDPNIAFMLLLVGIYGIILEFMHPGAMAPGVVGSISLIVALTALSVLPVNYGGLVLLLLGIAMMAVEAFIPGMGVIGLGGVAAFVLGALFLFDPSQTSFAVAWSLIAGAAVVSAAFFLGIGGLALKARRRPVRTGAEEMIGSVGEVVSWQGEQGRIRIHGELWAARANASFAAGQRVRVVDRGGLTLVVQPAM